MHSIGRTGLIYILFLVWGANSIMGYDTLTSFSLAERTIEIPLPNLGVSVGIILIAFPFIHKLVHYIITILMTIATFNTKRLPTQLEPNEARLITKIKAFWGRIDNTTGGDENGK